MELDDLISEYVNEIKNDPLFIELLELKKIINDKYQKLIISFKTNESLYNDAKEGNYLTKDITNKLINSKKELYNKEEVKRYFELERLFDEKLNSDFNEIKENISNKFESSNWLFRGGRC